MPMSIEIGLPAEDKKSSLRGMFRTALNHPLAIMAFLFPVAIVFDTKLVPVFMVVTLVGIVVRDWPLRLRLWWPLLIGLGVFAGWALLSAVWSLDALHSLARFFRFSLAVIGGVLLCGVAASRDFDSRRIVGLSLAGGFLVASAISLFAGLVGGALPWPSVATYLSLMPLLSFGAIAALGVFVLIAMLEDRWNSPLVYLAIAAAVAAIYFRGNTASGIALAIAAVAAVFVYFFGRRVLLTLAVALPIFFLGSATLLHQIDVPARAKEMGWTLSHSAGHRLIVWRYVYAHILEKPLLGWGLHTSRIMPDKDDVRAADDPRYDDIFAASNLSRKARIGLMPMHPHNATLQAWLELGVVGAVLYAMVFSLAMLAFRRLHLSRIVTAAGAGLIVSVFVIGQLSFSAWQSWWLCYQFVAAAFFLFIVRKNSAGAARAGSAAEA
jgi:O-antigen ligase